MYTGNVTDEKQILGLLGNSESLAAKVHELEKRLLNVVSCYGMARSGDTCELDGLTAFRLEAERDEQFGKPIQLHDGRTIMGGDPSRSMSLVRVFTKDISEHDRILYEIQFLHGTGHVEDAVVWTSIYIVPNADGMPSPVEVLCPRISCNNKLWAVCKCNTAFATISTALKIVVFDA